MGATSVNVATRDTGRTDNEPTLGALVASASRDLSALVRSEIDLAKAEIKDDVSHAVKGGGMFGAAAFLGLLATILLSFALAYALFALGLSRWLSFLVVGILYLAVAGVLAFLGLKQVKQVKPPQEAIQSTKETVEVLKGAAKS
jgi:Putative Actinobacterial Holin-X, holin superfamily III